MSSTPRLPRVQDDQADRNFRRLAGESGDLRTRMDSLEEEGLPPSGKAGGVLKGTYPNPEFAQDMATQVELENGLASKQDAATAATDAELAAEKEAREAADAERVKGPGSATDLIIAVFEGTTGKIIKAGARTIAEVLARANHTGTQLASTISDFDTQVRTSRLDQMAAAGADVSFGGNQIIDLGEPAEGDDGATKAYVDAAASAAAAGLSLKNPVDYASTANIIGFTEVSSTVLEKTAPLTIDGATPAVGDRILLKNQLVAKRNGIWEVTKSETFGGGGTFGGEGTFGEGSKVRIERTPDANTEGEIKQGMFVPVASGGPTNGNTAWTLTTPDPIVIGTTELEFAQFSATPGGAAGGDLTGTYPNPSIGTGVIDNANVNAAAAIAYSKLNLAASITGTGDAAAGNRNYGVVEALPTSPTPAKGDVCRYKAAAGLYWDLVYTGEETYPWAKIGGPPLRFKVKQKVEGVTSSTYASFATAVKLTTPLGGDYDIEWGASAIYCFGTGNAFLGVSVDGSTPGTTEALDSLWGTGDTAIPTGAPGPSNFYPKAGIGSGKAIEVKYAMSTGNGGFIVPWLTIDPTRVG